MEQDAKTRLMELLDQSLLDHTKALGAKEGGPDISDIYKLQGLAELHHHLKAEHRFTTAEIEALLWFQDPLAVASACWEVNGHEHHFPICELMDKIDAYEEFPMSASVRQQTEELKETLERNYAEYTASLMGMSKEKLIEISQEITAMRDAHTFMLDDFPFVPSEVSNLLKLQNPLYFLASNWLLPADDPGFVHDILSDLNSPAYLQEYIDHSPAEKRKPSVLEQLRNTTREAGQRPPTERKPHRDEAR